MAIIVGSVGVQLVPDATGFPEKTRSALHGLNVDVGLNLKDAEARAELEDVTRPRTAPIEANADTAEAEARLDDVARPRTVKVGVDRTSLSGAESGLSGLATAALSLGPALVPLTAVAGGLSLALAAPVGAAAGGAGLYAFLAGKAIKGTEAQSKALDQLKKKVDSAQQSLDRATTKAGKKTAQERLAAATTAYDAALKKVNPQQARFLKAQEGVASGFTKLERDAGPALFGPLTTGLKIIDDIMPHLERPLNAVSGALGDVLGQVDKSVKGGQLDSFLGFFTREAPPAIKGFAALVGNLGSGFGHLAEDFAPLSGGILGDLDHLTSRFSKWAASDPKSIKDFMSYVHQEGPGVARALHSFADATGEVVKAAAPLGGPILRDLSTLADLVAKIAGSPAGTPLLAFAGALALVKKASPLLSKLGGGGGGLAGKAGIAGVASKAGVVPVYVTNLGAGGGLGAGGAGGAASAGEGLGSTVAKGGLLGWLSKFAPTSIEGLGGLGIVGSAVVGGMSLGDSVGHEKGGSRKPLSSASFNSFISTRDQKRAVDLTKQQAAAQASLNVLLQAPALPDYGKALKALPKAVQTTIATPGAIDSYADVHRLAKEYGLTPRQVSTIVAVTGVGGALTAVQRLKRELAGLRDKTLRVNVLTTNSQANKNQKQRADITPSKGMTVPGQRAPYGDKVLAMLAPGEEVISNSHGQADRYRGLLKSINADRRYASGGTVGGSKGSSRTSVVMPTSMTVSIGDMPFEGYVHAIIDDHLADRAAMGMS